MLDQTVDAALRASTDLPGMLMEDQRRRWATGERPFVEEYLRVHVSLLDDVQGLLDLIYNEVCLRSDFDELPSKDEYIRRFPSHGAELERLFEVHDAIDAALPNDGKLEERDWIGRRLGHYRITSWLGAGGMGQVFRATDLALDRDVALKVLPDHFTSAMKRRLAREARESARLQHPHIATFYETDVAAGCTYIAMEYVQGRTLREIIDSGPLPLERAVAIATCVLEALGHAHAWDILHRDIKPENILVIDASRAKLLDFGLAQRIQGVEETAASGGDSSAVVGTPGYMAPEQINAQPLNVQSDLFAVGVVLYEMLTGTLAFPGETVFDRIERTLLGDVELSCVPSTLRSIVARAIEPRLEQRYTSTAAFLRDLGVAVHHLRDSCAPKRIAIQRFERAADVQEWIAFGLSEALERDLRASTNVHLVPSADVIAAAATLPGEATAEKLGRALSCDLVVSGSLRKFAGELLAQLLLTDVPTGQLLSTAEITSSSDDLADAVKKSAAFLRSQVDERPIEGLAESSREAYEYYARGRMYALSSDKSALGKAEQMFQKCIAMDPDHAPALSGLASAHALRYVFTTNKDDLRTAEQYARQAVAADPNDGSARAWLGYVLGHQGDYLAGYAEQLQGMQRDPTNFLPPYFAISPFVESCDQQRAEHICRRLLGNVEADVHLQRRREAVRLVRRALGLNPNHGWSWLALGCLLMDLHDFDSCRFALQKAIELERVTRHNATAGAEGYLGECERRAGNLDKARSHCLRSLDALEMTDIMYRDTFRGTALRTLGRAALENGDCEAADAAFHQAIQHLEGRERARAGGHPLVQTMAGRAQVRADQSLFDEALSLFRERSNFDFTFMWCCTDDVTLLDLSHAAARLKRIDLASDLLTAATAAGATQIHATTR